MNSAFSIFDGLGLMFKRFIVKVIDFDINFLDLIVIFKLKFIINIIYYWIVCCVDVCLLVFIKYGSDLVIIHISL